MLDFDTTVKLHIYKIIAETTHTIIKIKQTRQVKHAECLFFPSCSSC
jgi:hypothetical protein